MVGMDLASIGLDGPFGVLGLLWGSNRYHCRSGPDLHGVRSCVPRRSSRTPNGRAIRNTCTRFGGDCYRDGANRFCHDCRSSGTCETATRHGLRSCDDRVQRYRRPVSPLGRRASSRTRLSSPGSECRISRFGCAPYPYVSIAARCDNRARSLVQHVAAYVRWNSIAGALWLLRFFLDGEAACLLSTALGPTRG